MERIYPSQIDTEITSAIQQIKDISKTALENFNFCEFTLEELGLPSADVLLSNVLEIKNHVGVKFWTSKSGPAKNYYGFSLKYNPNYIGDIKSIYHQSWGSTSIIKSFSREVGSDPNLGKKDTYYDSYAFRLTPPIVENFLGDFLKKFSFPVLRSRVAFYRPLKENETGTRHIDEVPTELLRLNIPLQTSPEHLLEIYGKDEFGNHFELKDKHLEVGKAYMWNTRIPHRIYAKSIPKNNIPRVHIVIGMSPWYGYNKEEDYFYPNQFYGKSIKEIVENKLFANLAT